MLDVIHIPKGMYDTQKCCLKCVLVFAVMFPCYENITTNYIKSTASNDDLCLPRSNVMVGHWELLFCALIYRNDGNLYVHLIHV